MKKKLKYILLIDDNEADNFFHQKIIKEMDIAEHIEVAVNGALAIEFLKKENQVPPELIFLDINMPIMNGWEFLEAYKELKNEQKSKIVIVMLTTSTNPEELKKAKQMKDITGLESKPLTKEILKEIIEQYLK
jgi:CheY-like chemotaxis protein